jgi:hypothetical protein
MPMSGVWTPDQTFKCIDFNCGCELKVVTPPQRPGLQTLSRPQCVCGGPMRRWPQAVFRNDQFNDI